MIDDVAKITLPLCYICSKLRLLVSSICNGICDDEVICMPSITFNVVVAFLTKKKSLVVYCGNDVNEPCPIKNNDPVISAEPVYGKVDTPPAFKAYEAV